MHGWLIKVIIIILWIININNWLVDIVLEGVYMR